MSNKPNTKGRKPPARPPATVATRPWWQTPFAGLGLVVLIAAIAAIAINSGSDDDANVTTTTETAFAEALGTPLPVLAEPDTAIGMSAPLFSAQTLAGDRVQLGNDGVARLYGFFAHWCPHCQADLPRTVEWLGTNQLPEGVDVVAVSTSVDPTADNYPPSDWFAREGWPGIVLLDDDEGSLATGMGLSSFPYWVAVDADGTVVQRASGELTDDQLAALIAAITPDETTSAPSGDEDAAGLRTVSPADADAIIASNDEVTVLDIRTPDEFDAGHLDGATLIDFYEDDFADQLAMLDPEDSYVLYCQSGNRSSQALAIMEDLGFTDVADVDGGILAWADAGLPTAR